MHHQIWPPSSRMTCWQNWSIVLAGRSTTIFPISEKGCSLVVVIICRDRRRAVCSLFFCHRRVAGHRLSSVLLVSISCFFLYHLLIPTNKSKRSAIDTTIKGITYGGKVLIINWSWPIYEKLSSIRHNQLIDLSPYVIPLLPSFSSKPDLARLFFFFCNRYLVLC